jgi:AcrR family transcriptional regulator
MTRKEELLESAADYVLENGLIGLSLRPLAAALGTSDRMLLYHFTSRDQLVTSIVDLSTERAIAVVRALPAARGIRPGVLRLWEAYRGDPLGRCVDVYVQAAATGLIGREPYRSITRAGNERWSHALADYLQRCGAPPRRLGRIVTVVDSTLLGLHLALATDDPTDLSRGVADLANAAHAIALR